MKSITQIAHYRQSLILYAAKYGVTKAARRYKVNRQYIYRWKNRYDGTLSSLMDRSHRPNHHPNQHTDEELTLIRNMRRRNPNAGIVVLWVKLRQRGYTRSISGLYRILVRSGQMAVKLPNPKYIPKPYEKMLYPGQRVQIDVKFVPAACLVGDVKGKSSTNTPLSMNTRVSVTLKHLKNTALILPQCSSSTALKSSLTRSSAFKQTTDPSLQTG